MAISANAIARSAIVTVSVVVATATSARWIAQPSQAAEAPAAAPAPSIVTGGGVTLHSVNVNFPRSENTFPGGARADAINNNCLICHSTGMVLDQANLSRAGWQSVVDQMRNDFKAPFGAQDGAAIVDYVVDLKAIMTQSAGRQPDPKHGAVIVAQGTAAGAPPCALCHAFNGVSDASGAFPRIAGQSSYYLASQLRDFASGVRESALMTPIAKALSADDLADVTAYFAGINAPHLPLRAPDPALVKRGAELAEAGGPDRVHCDNCHGPGGSGEPPVIPYLAGQYDHYIAFTLQMWRKGFRNNSPDAMEAIAKTLSDQDLAAVAAYYQQVPSTGATAASQ